MPRHTRARKDSEVVSTSEKDLTNTLTTKNKIQGQVDLRVCKGKYGSRRVGFAVYDRGLGWRLSKYNLEVVDAVQAPN